MKLMYNIYLISEVCRFDTTPLVNQVSNHHPLIAGMEIVCNPVPQLWPVGRILSPFNFTICT